LNWKTNLAADTAGLKMRLKCSSGYSTWTDSAGANENKPVTCLDWYTAFAFCAWDGGRLPTEAEWNYAAVGGNEQRSYPWPNPSTSTTIDDSYAVYCGSSCAAKNVGSKSPKGDGRWGHSDLAGNAMEWTLDYKGPYPNPCDNCAYLINATFRVARGGFFRDNNVGADNRPAYNMDPASNEWGMGARCARPIP
jgi:formylglycine-generating enzyme required for sulfatase activity